MTSNRADAKKMMRKSVRVFIELLCMDEMLTASQCFTALFSKL